MLGKGTKSTCIVALPVLGRGQPEGGESCIVLESGPTRSLVTKLTRISYLQARNAANEATSRRVRRFAVGCRGGVQRIRMIAAST